MLSSCSEPGTKRVPNKSGEAHQITVSRGDAGAFLLEIVGLIRSGRLGWHIGGGGMIGLALTALLVAIASGIWATFRTRGYVPSGREPVSAIPGPLRLTLEFTFYATAVFGFWISGWNIAAIALIVGVIIVTIMLRDRTLGFLRTTGTKA